jgi:hypothetical protein
MLILQGYHCPMSYTNVRGMRSHRYPLAGLGKDCGCGCAGDCGGGMGETSAGGGSLLWVGVAGLAVTGLAFGLFGGGVKRNRRRRRR